MLTHGKYIAKHTNHVCVCVCAFLLHFLSAVKTETTHLKFGKRHKYNLKLSVHCVLSSKCTAQCCLIYERCCGDSFDSWEFIVELCSLSLWRCHSLQTTTLASSTANEPFWLNLSDTTKESCATQAELFHPNCFNSYGLQITLKTILEEF